MLFLVPQLGNVLRNILIRTNERSGMYKSYLRAKHETLINSLFNWGATYSTGACPVKFFEKDSAADLSAGILADLTGVPSATSSEQNKGSFVLPWGGGGYFRLIPFPLFKIGIKFILGQENAYLFYFHPWEIDPEQPKVNQASSFYKFRHYINLNKTYSKLSKLIGSFRHQRFLTCKQYLDEFYCKACF